MRDSKDILTTELHRVTRSRTPSRTISWLFSELAVSLCEQLRISG